MMTSREWRICIGRECVRIFRFGVIGFLSWLIYFFGYTVLSRFLWVTGNRTVENAIAIALSAVFNFYAHRSWTFRHAKSMPQAQRFWRYALVAGTGAALNTLLFWIGHALLHWYDLLVLVLASGLMACYTYVLHRLYTFPIPKNQKN